MNLTTEFTPIIEWAKEKGILEKATTDTQFSKLMEEIEELSIGMMKKDKEEIKDAIGDCIVVLTILAKMYDMTVEDCINSAYEIISKRTGKMANGVFVKNS